MASDMAKRSCDLVCSLLGLLVLSPLYAVAALLVKMSGPGPVLFHQVRIGRDFHPFEIYKFRTMTNEAVSDPPITVRGDRRVTSIGRFLRKTKLDELPQLVNVVKGDMSLVGPRPEVPQYVERFRDDYEEILKVRPGITDEASILFRHEDAVLASAPDPQKFYEEKILPRKIALAKTYVLNRSLTRDLLLILRTFLHL